VTPIEAFPVAPTEKFSDETIMCQQFCVKSCLPAISGKDLYVTVYTKDPSAGGVYLDSVKLETIGTTPGYCGWAAWIGGPGKYWVNVSCEGVACEMVWPDPPVGPGPPPGTVQVLPGDEIGPLSCGYQTYLPWSYSTSSGVDNAIPYECMCGPLPGGLTATITYYYYTGRAFDPPWVTSKTGPFTCTIHLVQWNAVMYPEPSGPLVDFYCGYICDEGGDFPLPVCATLGECWVGLGSPGGLGEGFAGNWCGTFDMKGTCDPVNYFGEFDVAGCATLPDLQIHGEITLTEE
jgi:hypothetical protein